MSRAPPTLAGPFVPALALLGLSACGGARMRADRRIEAPPGAKAPGRAGRKVALLMARRKSRYRVLVYEAVGFATILVVTWMDEFFGFPEEYLGGELPAPEWVGGAVETAAILAVAIPTLLLTRRLISRLFYLEGFLTVCAWCRKINVDERWISMEDYFASGFRTRTSHGMCPDCFEEATRKMT